MGALVLQHALVCPAWRSEPYAPLDAIHEPILAWAPSSHQETLAGLSCSYAEAEALITDAHMQQLTFLRHEIDAMVMGDLEQEDWFTEEKLEALEEVVDRCYIRGASPHLYVAAAQFVYAYWRDTDPPLVSAHAARMYQRLNVIIAERAIWWASRHDYTNMPQVLREIETKHVDTYPHVVLAVVLAWHYGIPLHWAVTLTRMDFQRVQGQGLQRGATVVVVHHQVRRALTPPPAVAENLLHSVLASRSSSGSLTPLLPMHAPMLEECFAALFGRLASSHGCAHVPALQQIHGLAIEAAGASYVRFDEHIRTFRHSPAGARFLEPADRE